MNEVLITSNGQKILLERQVELQNKLREVLSQKGDAYENGGNGWHDNFAFEELTRQEGILNKQISEISDLLSRVKVISSKPKDNFHVGIGHTVVLEDEEGRNSSYEVVGYGESDLTLNPPKVEYRSPLLSAFFGASIGEAAKISVGGKIRLLTLVEIKE